MRREESVASAEHALITSASVKRHWLLFQDRARGTSFTGWEDGEWNISLHSVSSGWGAKRAAPAAGSGPGTGVGSFAALGWAPLQLWGC